MPTRKIRNIPNFFSSYGCLDEMERIKKSCTDVWLREHISDVMVEDKVYTIAAYEDGRIGA